MEQIKSVIDDGVIPPLWRGTHVESPVYVVSGQTFLDIADEMTLRHPGYIATTRPYDNQETFFFGHPSFFYYATDRSMFVKSRTVHAGVSMLYRQTINEAIKPIRSYHVVTTGGEIISNDIIATGTGTYTEFVVGYQDGNGDIKSQQGRISQRLKGSEHLQAVRVNDNLDERDVRTFAMDFGNCGGKWMAERYTLALMQHSLHDVYQGSITCIGIPNMFPHDICFIIDTDKEIVGAVGVEKVIQELDADKGFVTIWTPDLIVDVNDVTLGLTNIETAGMFISDVVARTKLFLTEKRMGMLRKMKLPAEIAGAAANVMLGARVGLKPLLRTNIGLAAATVAGGLYVEAKVGARLRFRQPIILSPLLKGSTPFLAGLNGFQHNTVIGSAELAWRKGKAAVRDYIDAGVMGFGKYSTAIGELWDDATTAVADSGVFKE